MTSEQFIDILRDMGFKVYPVSDEIYFRYRFEDWYRLSGTVCKEHNNYCRNMIALVDDNDNFVNTEEFGDGYIKGLYENIVKYLKEA